MKKILTYIFILFATLMFLSNVDAKERIVCNYTAKSINEWEVEYSKTLSLELILHDNYMEAEKIFYTITPFSECSEKLKIYASHFSDQQVRDYCKKKSYNYSPSEILIKFEVLEGENCAPSLYLSLGTSQKELYEVKEGTVGAFELKSSNKSSINKVNCGNGEGAVTNIPKQIPKLTSLIVNVIQIAVPIILVIMGSIDLFKGITAGKEDEMKKGQKIFVKRLVLGAIIFFVVIVVKFLISIVADTNVSNIVDCIDCFVSNEC
ncbi:MAG: hypothetical protein IKL65_05875 [Bacilli bacterium]|nr:hypothetical protein [Bacilli bacterium]